MLFIRIDKDKDKKIEWIKRFRSVLPLNLRPAKELVDTALVGVALYELPSDFSEPAVKSKLREQGFTVASLDEVVSYMNSPFYAT